MHLFARGALISGARITEKVLAFLIIIFASRQLGSEGIGEFFYYFSLASLFIPLMDLGFEKLLLQKWWDHTRQQRMHYLGKLLLIKLFTGCLALVAITITDIVVQGDNANSFAAIAAFVAIYITTVGDLIRQPAHAESIIIVDMTVPIVSRLLTLVLYLAFTSNIHNGYELLYVYAIANIAGTVISCWGLRGYRPRWDKDTTLKQLIAIGKSGIPFSMTHLFVMISLYIDTIFLGHFSTMSEVGDYNAAYKLILALTTLGGGVCYTIFPLLTNKSEGEQGGQVFSHTLKFFTIAFGTCSIGGIFLGPWIIEMVYGDEFKKSATVFQILCILIFIASLTNLVGQSLEALGKQKTVMMINLKSAGFNILTNLIMIPWLGMIGAAITTITTEIIVLIIQITNTRKNDAYGITLSQIKRPVLFLCAIAALYSTLPYIGEQTAEATGIQWMKYCSSLSVGILLFVVLFIPFRKYWLNTDKVESNNESSDGK